MKIVEKELRTHPGGIKVGLNSGFGAFAEPQNLSAGCQDRQQSQGNHLQGLHLQDLQRTKERTLKRSALHQEVTPELSQQDPIFEG